MKVIQDILAQARTHPDALAVIGDDGAIGYRDLVMQAGGIAQMLSHQGALPAPVAIAMPKSPEAVAVMLGVLLAGRTYMPLDPALPIMRRSDMLADSNTRLGYAATEAEAARLSAEHPGIEFRAARRDLSLPAVPVVASVPEGRNFALLYTSGSTNRPKGVRLGRAGVDCFVDWALNYFALGPQDRLASHAPFGFDISLLDVWAGLAAGAQVHLVPEGQMINGRYLIRFLEDRAITFWQSVPTPITAIADEIAAGHPVPRALRQLCTTGEALPQRTRNRLAVLGADVQVHNIYGCTETNDSFVYSLPASNLNAEGDLPIGYALAYIDYRICDEAGADVPIGQTGQLLVRSDAGFNGYTDPALTEAAHVTLDDGRRYYRSNDLVLSDRDGMLHFIGRADHTVKLHGYRIDLREVEAALQQHPELTEVVALLQSCKTRGKRLIAVLGGGVAQGLSSLQIKAHCARFLPRQAIPDSFVRHDPPLPRNGNGKIDRRAVADWLSRSAVPPASI